jgi:NAD(P) transhydrogenase
VKQDIAAADLIARLQKTLDHEVEVLEHQFSRNLVRTACGEARFLGPNQIEVTAEGGETRVVSAANVLIACGTRPFRPDYVPFDSKTVFDSDEPAETAAQSRRDRRRGDRRRIRHHLQRARRRGDADRTAADIP